MVRALVLAALALANSAAAQGDRVLHGSLRSGGLERTYRLFVPAKPGPHPALVVVLHGGFGNGDGAAEQTGFDDEARAHGFLAVYPDGVGRSWNAFTCCGPAQRGGVDDVGFLVRLIGDLRARYGVDPRRVYATGISNGGLMSYALACQASDRIAAIGPVAATMDFAGCSPHRPVSVLHIHGSADQNIPFQGGPGTKGVTPNDWRSVPSTIERWRRLDRCRPPSVRRHGDVTLSRSECSGGTAVELDEIQGGGHSWPGGERMSLVLDPPSTALDASAKLWRFFAAHPRRS
jgi:polyhydroxybutyrate depolymerase